MLYLHKYLHYKSLESFLMGSREAMLPSKEYETCSAADQLARTKSKQINKQREGFRMKDSGVFKLRLCAAQIFNYP